MEHGSRDCGNVQIYTGDKLVSMDGAVTIPEGIKNTDGYIREFLDKNGGVVDYVHGEENLKKLIDDNKNSVGILFEKIDKENLFKYVASKGAFPRKTFSMGEGVEKRYYLEGRVIKNG